MALNETLVLDIAKALQGIDRIEAELTATAKRFGVGLAEALGILSRPTKVEVDAREVTTGIDAAVRAADTSVVVSETDAADVTRDVTSAVDAADTSVTIADVDARPVTGGIDAAVDAADSTVTITDVDAGNVTAAIDNAVRSADTTVAVDVSGTEGLDRAGSSLGVIAAQAGGAAAAVDGTKQSFRSLGEVTKVVLGAVALKEGLGFLKDSVDVASNLAEQVSATTVVFGTSEDAIRDFASTAAVNLGLAEDQTLETSNALGGLFTALGLTQKAASELGPVVIQRAADIASLKNLDVPDALEKIRSGLVGEVEPLRSLGVSFNAAQVEAKALELGLVGTGREASEAAKVQARLALILDQTEVAAGNFALTADGLANSSRTLSAEFRNTRAELGERLLPSALDLVDLARDELLPLIGELGESGFPLLTSAVGAGVPVLRGFLTVVDATLPLLDAAVSVIDAIPEPVLATVGSFLALRAVLNPLQKTIPAVGTAIANLVVPNAALGLGTAATAATFTPWGLAIAGASAALALGIAAIGAHSRAQEEQRKQLEEGRKAFLDSEEATEKYVESLVRGRIESKNQSDDLTRVGLSLDQYRELLDGGRVGLERFLSILAASGEITETDRRMVLGLTAANTNYRASVDANVQGNIGLVKSFQAQQKALQDQAKAALGTLVAEGQLTVGTGRAIEVLNRRADGTVDYVAAVKEANEVVRQQALAEVAAGNATEAARAKNAALKTVYDELALVLKGTTEGTTASETALAKYGPSLGAAVDQYVRGKPSIEALAAIQAQFGIDTALLSGVVDEHAAKLAAAKEANEAWVKAGVEGLTSITEAGKILDEDKSFQTYIDRIRKTAEEQVAFSSNVAKLIARGADDIARLVIEGGVSMAGFAAELTKTGDKRLAAQETQVEKTKGLFTRAETITAANGTALVNITTASNTAISNAPPPDVAGPITRAFDPAVSGIRSKFADFQRIAATGGDDAGGAFALGFADGIRQRAPTATQEAKTMADRTAAEAKRLLRAFSPSRVMMDLGGDVAEGLALGIAAGVADVERAADRLALAAIPSLGSATAPAVASVVVADTVVRSGSAASSAAAGPAVVNLRFETTFGPGADRESVTAGLREFARGELADALGRVKMRVNMQGSGR